MSQPSSFFQAGSSNQSPSTELSKTEDSILMNAELFINSKREQWLVCRRNEKAEHSERKDNS